MRSLRLLFGLVLVAIGSLMVERAATDHHVQTAFGNLVTVVGGGG